MDEKFISRQEHDEYVKRMEADHDRFNERIRDLEEATKQNTDLLISINKLAQNVENMQKELVLQREEIDELKERDGNKWREAVKYVVITLIGAVIGYILKNIGL